MSDGKAASSGVMPTITTERLTSMGASVVTTVNARGQKKNSVAAIQQRTLPKTSAWEAMRDEETLGCKVAMWAAGDPMATCALWSGVATWSGVSTAARRWRAGIVGVLGGALMPWFE